VIICVATDRCKSVQDMPILYVAVVFCSRLQFRQAYIKKDDSVIMLYV